MKLYHFSEHKYNVGDIIPPQKGNSISYEIAKDIQKRTIECFDNYIVKHYPNYVLRKKAMFAFDDVKYAHMYGVQSHRKGAIYEIEMNVSYRGPFTLVNGLLSLLDYQDKVDGVLQEYFCPKADWKVFEYIGEEFIVTNVITDRIPYIYDFQIDHDLFDKLFVE